jgi:hypothetical protein
VTAYIINTKKYTNEELKCSILHLCALEMHMAQSLFADENTPEWAFISGAKKRNLI